MKKLFIGLLTIIGLGFTSFGYCYDFETFSGYNTVIIKGDTKIIFSGNLTKNNILCFRFGNTFSSCTINGNSITTNSSSDLYCIFPNGNEFINVTCSANQGYNVAYLLYDLDSTNYLNNNCPSCSSCQSDLTTCQSSLSSCQTSYSGCMNSFNSNNCQALFNLIPIESVDTNYCQINNLCPGSSIPCVGSGSSNFYIFKDNRYIPITGTTNIFVNLPEYLDYSYDYSNGGEDLDVDLNYNVDTEYIDGIIKTQNYKPTTEDFTNLVGMLAPYSKYLIFLVFIFIIWAWIKKPFKSKKL